jgi:hypothetical protein
MPKRLPAFQLKSEDGLPDLTAQLAFHREHGKRVLFMEVNGKRIAKRLSGPILDQSRSHLSSRGR